MEPDSVAIHIVGGSIIALMVLYGQLRADQQTPEAILRSIVRGIRGVGTLLVALLYFAIVAVVVLAVVLWAFRTVFG